MQFFVSLFKKNLTRSINNWRYYTINMASTHNLTRQSLFDLSGKVALVTGMF
jgi:hypothetical protein